MITADCVGSNGVRVRPWKWELQNPADQAGLTITVCHLPPGKWNKVEHRLFSFITQNWRGKTLVSYQAIVQLIASTTTRAGLNMKREVDPNQYPSGIKLSDDEMAAIDIRPHELPGEWNHTTAPGPPKWNDNLSAGPWRAVAASGVFAH